MIIPINTHLQFDQVWNTYMSNIPIYPKSEKKSDFQLIQSLTDIADDFDCFLLDGFGVINRGDTTIPGMLKAFNELKAKKEFFILSNGSSMREDQMIGKYHDHGFQIPPENLFSSRTAYRFALNNMNSKPEGKWGIIGHPHGDPEEFFSGVTDYRKIIEQVHDLSGILFLSSALWKEELNDELINALLRKNVKHLKFSVTNPDMSAPFEDFFTSEPGYYSTKITQATGIQVEYFGKPFYNAYEPVLEKIESLGFKDKSRIAMLGDTPFTDILGGNNAGIKSILCLNYGLLNFENYSHYLEACGIYPDFVWPF